VKWRDQLTNSLVLELKLSPPKFPPFFAGNPDLNAQTY